MVDQPDSMPPSVLPPAGLAGADTAPVPGPDLEAVALLSDGLAELTTTVADLAESHFAVRDQVAALAAQLRPGPGGPAPADLRWRVLDRPTASTVWVWLIDWVGWCVERFQLTEEIPACWPQHPALIEELTALAAAWHAAYDPRAGADAPLRWLEAFTRSRARLRDWDDATRCRNGEHHPRRVDLTWPATWRDQALDAAETDQAGRPIPDVPANGGEPS